MIVILDFGSQYTQLIARRLRELEVYAEILPFSAKPEQVRAKSPKGIILSGSPFSVEAPVRLAPAAVAIWLPVVIACLGSITVLLHQEDG